MALPALVLLSAADTDAPPLPAVATVSKEDAWDDGARAIGVEAAAAGLLWCDRPYFTGNPTVEWAAEKVRANAAQGGVTQIGNELNLPLEGWEGGPEAYDAYYIEVQAAAGTPALYEPPSPGVPDWQAWVSLRDAPAYGVHAYGSCAQMQEVVQWYLDNVTGQLYVTECNFGAGNTVDIDVWAREELAPFLAWCNEQPRVVMAAYFAWAWNESSTLPTPLDARGTDVPAVLAASEPTGTEAQAVEAEGL
jgi:hypothetical protein